MHKDEIRWNFIPLKNYIAPSCKISSNLIRFKKLSEHSLIAKTFVNNNLVKLVDWDAIAIAFDKSIMQDQYGLHKGLSQICVGLFGSASHMLKTWAIKNKAHILEPPSIDQLLISNSEIWPELFHKKDTVFVIPYLEKCFLRHYRGLRWIRQIAETAWENSCQIVIGCDLWAWKYLESTLKIDLLCSTPLIMEPFNFEQLKNWLSDICLQKNLKLLIGGEEIFISNSKKTTQFFNEFLEISYGCVTIAEALLREILLSGELDSTGKTVKLDLETDRVLYGSLHNSRIHLYVLQALLIHSNLSINGLVSVLPFTKMEIQKSLIELFDIGFLVKGKESWEVAPQRYFDVFKELKSSHFSVIDLNK